MKKLLALFMVIVMSMAVLSGCGKTKNTATTDTKKQSTEKIKLGLSAYPGWYPWFAAEGFKTFEANGVNVELVWFPTYSDSLQAFNSGKIDALSVALSDTIAPHLKGVDFKIVLINDNSNGADGLVAKKEYKSIQDLKGKTVAAEYGTIAHFFLLNALKTAGMTEKDINLVNMTTDNAGPAMIAGSVEAAELWEPSLSLALSNDKNHLLYDSSKTPGLIPDVLAVRGEVLKTRRDDIKKIITAYFDGLKMYNDNPATAIKFMAKGAGTTEDEMKVAMRGSKLFSIEDNVQAMTQKAESYKYLPYTTLKNAAFLKGTKMVEGDLKNPEEMLDSTFVTELLKERGSTPVPNTKIK